MAACINTLGGCGAVCDASSEQVIEKSVRYVTNDGSGKTRIIDEQDAGSEISDPQIQGTEEEKTETQGTEAQETDEQGIETQVTGTRENDTQESDTEAGSDDNRLTGSIEVIKKAEFVLLTDDGTYYEFLFVKKPLGLTEIEPGTRVKVTYKGDISEDNVISGGIISIERQ